MAKSGGGGEPRRGFSVWGYDDDGEGGRLVVGGSTWVRSESPPEGLRGALDEAGRGALEAGWAVLEDGRDGLAGGRDEPPSRDQPSGQSLGPLIRRPYPCGP